MGWTKVSGRQLECAARQDLTVQVLALEDNALGAGAALGCSYANSHEYEAELIATRRAAGVYQFDRNPRWLRFAAVAAGLAIVTLIAVAIG